MYLRACVFFVAISLCCATTVSAGTISLADLVDNNGSIVSGDKTFDEFTYTAGGDMPDAADVSVTDIQDGDGHYGIRFQGPFADLQGGGALDALITYRVTAAEGRLISDAHLAGNPEVIGGFGVISVTETFIPEAPNTMSIYDIEPDGQVNQAWVFFDEPLMRQLHVQKNILAFAGENAAATLSFVDQTFSQIPEPASFGLLASLACGILVIRRRLG